jgi:hypothetical protein
MNETAVMTSKCAEGMKPCSGRCIPQKAMCHSEGKTEKKGGLNAGHAALGAGGLGAAAVAFRNRKAIGEGAKSVADNFMKNRAADKRDAKRADIIGKRAKRALENPTEKNVGRQVSKASRTAEAITKSQGDKKSTLRAIGESAKMVGKSIGTKAKEDFGFDKKKPVNKPKKLPTIVMN